MLTVVITRPPFTYAFTTSLQYISILEKLYSLLLQVESNRFLMLLKFLSCCYSCCCCRKEHVTTVATRVVGGSFAFLTTNQSKDKRSRDTRKQVSKLLSFSHFFSLFKLSGKKKTKTKTLQRSVGRSCSDVGHRNNVPRPSALSAIAVTLRGPARCWPSQ